MNKLAKEDRIVVDDDTYQWTLVNELTIAERMAIVQHRMWNLRWSLMGYKLPKEEK